MRISGRFSSSGFPNYGHVTPTAASILQQRASIFLVHPTTPSGAYEGRVEGSGHPLSSGALPEESDAYFSCFWTRCSWASTFSSSSFGALFSWFICCSCSFCS